MGGLRSRSGLGDPCRELNPDCRTSTPSPYRVLRHRDNLTSTSVASVLLKLWRLLLMKVFLFSEYVSDAGLSVVLQGSVTHTACWVFSRAMWLLLHRNPLRHHRPVGDRGKPLQGRLETRQQDRALPGPCLTAEWSRSRTPSTTRPMRSWESTTGGGSVLCFLFTGLGLLFDLDAIWFVDPTTTNKQTIIQEQTIIEEQRNTTISNSSTTNNANTNK